MIDIVLFGVFPYVACTLAVVGSIWRYTGNKFGFSSLSSQFLEGRQLFYGSFPWHFGIMALLLGHLIGVVFPAGVKAWNGVPVRLYILEATALALGLAALAGLIVLIVRRASHPRIRQVTSPMDVVVVTLLLVQVVAGILTAVFYRWGSLWYLDSAAPYLVSILSFSPRWDYLAPMPLLMKLHVVNAFLLVAIFPFTRLVHIVSAPVMYLFRPYQLVRWNWPTAKMLEEGDTSGAPRNA